jgi:anaerobic magnesium-protoporphyrin IX monomethyl ester cyclase
MKVLFIHPNEYLSIGIPTGIAQLSAVLKNAGHSVDIFDFTFVKTEDDAEYLQKNANQGVYLPTEYTLEDLVAKDPVISLEKAFSEKIAEFEPELIAVSVMTGLFDKVINLLNKIPPACKVVFGGVHPTICPEHTLSYDIVDYICVGEGEEFLIELCDCLESGKDISKVKNLGYKKDQIIHINESRAFIDMDDLPVPDWSLFDQRHLFRPFLGHVYKGSFFVMSRGCPCRCTYCVNASLRNKLKECGRYFRCQSPKTTIKHIAHLKEHYGATWFKFADDSITFFTDEQLEELATGLQPLNIQFGCSIRPETTTAKKVNQLKTMGCVAATVGIESGSEMLRKNVLNRKMTNGQIENAIELLRNAGIRVSTFNMLGIPTETREDIFKTIALNKKCGIDAVNVYIVYPYPGTELSNKYQVSCLDDDGTVISVSKAAQFAMSAMVPAEVEGLLKTFELYTLLPEELWPLIKVAESDTHTSRIILCVLKDNAIKISKLRSIDHFCE